jgi:DNA invertase Pin-like site-specific DNA recombinase
MSTKTAVYVRVSTLDQEKGIESQEHALREYLAGHGIKDAFWFRDRVSGKDTHRPAFQKLQEAIFSGQVKTVVVWTLDRLSRSLRDGINVLTSWIDKKVRVVSITQQIDLDGAMGRMLAGILFALAEMERENLRENTKRGMAKARARGVTFGKRARLHAKDIMRLRQQGLSMGDIAAHLKCTRQTLYVVLEREGIDKNLI